MPWTCSCGASNNDMFFKCHSCGTLHRPGAAASSPEPSPPSPISSPAGKVSPSSHPHFEHASLVLRFKEKAFALTRSSLLQGLDEGSAYSLQQLGAGGWEMVAAVPFSTGGASFSVTGSANKTDAVIGFFKRPLSHPSGS